MAPPSSNSPINPTSADSAPSANPKAPATHAVVSGCLRIPPPGRSLATVSSTRSLTSCSASRRSCVASAISSLLSRSSAIVVCHRLRNYRRNQPVSQQSLEHQENDLERGPVAQSSADREPAQCRQRERPLRILSDLLS